MCLYHSEERRLPFSRQTADVIAKIGFKMFLGVSAEVGAWSETPKAFTLTLPENPFIEFVELPPSMSELRYCNMLVGIIKGVRHQLGRSFYVRNTVVGAGDGTALRRLQNHQGPSEGRRCH